MPKLILMTFLAVFMVGLLPRPGESFKCELTKANGRYLPDSPIPGRASDFYGNDSIAIGLGPEGNTITFKPGGAGFVLPDGSLAWKFLWAKVRLPMTIEGRRLDAPAPPLQSRLSHQFHDDTFQPSHLIFPTPGCWEITSRVGQSALTFVIKVVKIGEGPSRLASLRRMQRMQAEIEAQKGWDLVDRLRLTIKPETESPPW